MARFAFNYYETVKYQVKFDARDLDEAKALMWEMIHPQDLDDAEIVELKADIDVDYDFVEQIGGDDDEEI
jgi:hypothetical protein